MSGTRKISRPARALSPGVRLGQFTIREVVGSGVTAIVYAAEASNGDPVAIKVLRDELRHDIVDRSRFLREGRVLRQLDCPQIPRFVETGETERGAPFLAMELVHGPTLFERLKSGPLAIKQAVELGCQLLDALDQLHALSFVHCDVKPSNILLSQRPDGSSELKLVDFGLATPVGFREPADSAGPCGTPAYMAPEQALCGSLDESTDLYSASAVLYSALTGRKPFWGPDPRAVLEAVLFDDIVPLYLIRPGCPPKLEATIVRGLARRRSERHSSAAAMRQALLQSVRPRGKAA